MDVIYRKRVFVRNRGVGDGILIHSPPVSFSFPIFILPTLYAGESQKACAMTLTHCEKCSTPKVCRSPSKEIGEVSAVVVILSTTCVRLSSQKQWS